MKKTIDQDIAENRKDYETGKVLASAFIAEMFQMLALLFRNAPNDAATKGLVDGLKEFDFNGSFAEMDDLAVKKYQEILDNKVDGIVVNPKFKL